MFIQFGKELRLVGGNPDGVKMQLDPGVYNISVVEEGRSQYIHLEKTEKYKKTKILDAGVFKKIETYVNNFLMDEMFEARKIMHSLDKIGLLFTGEPGTGKTFLAGQICQKLVDEKNAIAIVTSNFSDYNLPKLIDSLRESNPDAFMVVVMDEFEKCAEWKLRDGGLLSYLDGNLSRNNVMNIALVNSTSSMKDFLLDRPGRFELVSNFDEHDDVVLKALVTSMAPVDYVERLDIDYITKQLIVEDRRTVDNINITLRDSIAELLYFDKHGSIKTFNSFKKEGKAPAGKKKIGFAPAKKMQTTKEQELIREFLFEEMKESVACTG